MTQTSPFIPYELSKYLTILLSIWGLVNSYNIGSKYLMMSILLLPAFFINTLGLASFNDLVNNGIAPLNLGLMVALLYQKKINNDTIYVYLKLILYTSLMVLAFAFFKTPDYDTIDFKLSANFTTSGGFGSNQVSTILGLGGFIIMLFILASKQITSYKWLDFALLFAFIFQGFLTFSRGGMLGMTLAIITFILVASKKQNLYDLKINRGKMILYAFIAFAIGIIGFLIVDDITGNSLALRYSGETAGTSEGYREKDLNIVTSNRLNIFLGDLDLWYTEPILGVGVGASKYLRTTVEGTVAHVELSRLLAEHGIFGLLFFVIWISLFFKIRSNNKDVFSIAVFQALFVLALYTSFHAAMRTYVTPLLTSIAMMTVIIPVKNKSIQI
jgi:hypothetical protein